MAAFDLEEQERVEALKYWWQENSLFVYIALAAFVIAVAGVKGWRYYKDSRADSAAEIYVEVEKKAASDPKQWQPGAAKLMDQHGDSPYAARAALAAARAAHEANDSETAQKDLRWVIDRSNVSAFQSIARLRLAAVLLDAKKYDEALKLLDQNKDEAFASLTAELRGDILAAEGKTPEARAAYTLALDKGQQSGNPDSRIVQFKLDALGAAQ
jgi:predicted negative regulator of RcsB-dependent stress response